MSVIQCYAGPGDADGDDDCSSDGNCLRNVQITIPEAVLVGESVKLRCDYDLEEAALYSIKWYRDSNGDEEFYRYVPKEAPPAIVFPLRGVHVDVSHSDAHSVLLLNVQKDLTGLFRCEVTADAPLFHTDIRSAHMIVVELPKKGPALNFEKKRISFREKMYANCTSGPSFPAANITWFIHGHQIYNTPLAHIFDKIYLDEFTGMLNSWSGLKLQAPAQLSRGEILRVRCLVTIYSIYRQSVEHDVFIDPPMGPLDPSRSTQYQEHSQGQVLVEEVIAGSSSTLQEMGLNFLLIMNVLNSVFSSSLLHFN